MAQSGAFHAWHGFAWVGAGLVGWLVAHGQHNGIVFEGLCPNSLRMQVARTGQFLAGFSNVAVPWCTRPLPQAHGAP